MSASALCFRYARFYDSINFSEPPCFNLVFASGCTSIQDEETRKLWRNRRVRMQHNKQIRTKFKRFFLDESMAEDKNLKTKMSPFCIYRNRNEKYDLCFVVQPRSLAGVINRKFNTFWRKDEEAVTCGM